MNHLFRLLGGVLLGFVPLLSFAEEQAAFTKGIPEKIDRIARPDTVFSIGRSRSGWI